MAFFMPYTVRHTSPAEAPLASLLRLVDDINTLPSGRRGGGCQYAYRTAPAARPMCRPWNPRFEAQETRDAYILRGELPGLNKDHVTIEFPEAQKIVISGKVHQPKPEDTPTTAATVDQDPAATTAATADAAADANADDAASETSSRSSYQATVEDAVDDDDDFEVVGQSAKSQEKQRADAQLRAEAEAAAAKAAQQQTQQQKQEPAQRPAIRQFSRSFTFTDPVEYDFVTASLKDGLLEVVIPKVKHQPHHVVVN